MNYPTDQFVKPQNKQPHARIIIRNRIKELLKINTDLGGNWFCSRPKPLFYTETPCGLIYFTNEPADHQNIVPRNYLRKCAVTTEVAIVAASERENEIDDLLDSRAYEIERALGADRFLGLKGLVQDVELLRTEPIDIAADGNVDVSAIRVYWDISYRTKLLYEGKLDEFLKYTADWHDPSSDDSVMQDEVTIREE